MKKFLAILILVLTFQTPSQADDIRDLQIEGISIGDSLLDHFSEEVIKKHYKTTSFYKQEFAKSSELIMNCDVSATRF